MASEPRTAGHCDGMSSEGFGTWRYIDPPEIDKAARDGLNYPK